MKFACTIAVVAGIAASGTAVAQERPERLPLGAEQPPIDELPADEFDFGPEPAEPEPPPDPTILEVDEALLADAVGGDLVQMEEIIVWGEPERRTEAGLLEIRKRSAAVSDGLSAQEMSRGPDSSASDAARRVVSVTVEDGRYVLIRGLGDRYVTTLLNGAPLPSTEPDRQAVPLDLFPTSLLANLGIFKSYTAEHPASFAGGTLRIESNEYPAERTMKFKVGTGGDTVATGQDRLGYVGGNLDFFGYDDGTRALPGAVPSDQPARISDGIDPETMEDIAEAFDNQWVLSDRTAYPDLSLGASIGDTVNVRHGEVGYLASTSFSHTYDVSEAFRAKVRQSGGDLEYREQLTSIKGSEKAGIGALFAGGWTIDADNRLDAVALYAHAGESSGQNLTGVSDSDGMGINSTRLAFVERSMAFFQLASDHRLRRARDLELSWQGNLSLTARDEPDTRDMVYSVLADGRQRFKSETGSGERFFSDLDEIGFGTGLDAALPLSRLTLKSGATVQRTDRSFSARRFRFEFVGDDPNVLFLPPEDIFSPELIGPSFRLQERTLQSDAYDASLTVAGGYLSSELQLSSRWRTEAGLRYEVASQSLTPGSPFALGDSDPDDAVDRTDASFVPATSAVFSVTDTMNLRVAYSYTLARPKFREIAPFLFTDYTRGLNISGNPDLRQTRIHNADLRWEWFFTDTELLASSLFYKEFRDPIEQVVVSATGGDVSFANAAGARTVGVELEGRLSLGRLAPVLDTVKLMANATLARSRVELAEDQVGAQTSSERPLQGQAPYVLNVGLNWQLPDDQTELTALYNLVGSRIEEVGFDTLPDTYQRPFHQLDVAASRRLGHGLKLKLGAKNLLDQSVTLVQGPLEVFRVRPGVSVSASLEWHP